MLNFQALTPLGSISVIGEFLILLAFISSTIYLFFDYSHAQEYLCWFLALYGIGCLGFLALQQNIASPQFRPIRYAQVLRLTINYHTQTATIYTSNAGTFHWALSQHPSVETVRPLTTLVLYRYQNALVRPYTAWQVLR